MTNKVDTDRTEVVTDNTINAMKNDVDAHTNNAIKTTKTDSNALSIMNTGASDVVIICTNNLCAENLAVGCDIKEQDASLAKSIEVEQYFQLGSIYYVQLLFTAMQIILILNMLCTYIQKKMQHDINLVSINLILLLQKLHNLFKF